MRVEAFLRESARRFPDKIALVAARADGEARLTYSALDAESNRLAHGLREAGVGRGERVIVFLNNSVEAVVSIFATLKVGAVFSLVNPSTKADKLAYILNKYRAAALITEERLLPMASEAGARAPSLALTLVTGGGAEAQADANAAATPAGTRSYEALLAASPAHQPEPGGIDVDLAMIVTTSGSTGLPKGVMMTHQNIVAAATSITTYVENRPDDIILSVLPLAFDYGLYQVLMSVKLGATLVLEKSFTYPAVVLQKLKAERVAGFPLVPTMVALLLQRKDIGPEMFPDLRYITSTAAALPPAQIRRLQDLFPRARIFSMYGLTECKRCTWLPPEQLARRADSVGIAIPGTEAYVVDEQGQRVAPGVVGELVIRGAHVFKGYWENEEATNRMLRPGPYPWEKVLHTGDLFKTDAEGFLYFVGRKDDIIKSAGEKVSPKEVENVLYALPGVRGAVVVGVPDSVLGMAIKAVIVADPEAGLTDRDVVRHCAAHLEQFMVPRMVEFRETLPQTQTGKIRRSEVQAEALGLAVVEE
jgi:long-chain acyl-CoA synthetase